MIWGKSLLWLLIVLVLSVLTEEYEENTTTGEPGVTNNPPLPVEPTTIPSKADLNDSAEKNSNSENSNLVIDVEISTRKIDGQELETQENNSNSENSNSLIVEISTSKIDGQELGTQDNNAENSNPLIVEISTGKIEGQELKTQDLQIPYYAYQGIPYGKPPVEELRFREPLPAEKWNGTLKTLEDRPKCVQSLPVSGSEDCLYLNVFAPKHGNAVLGAPSIESSDTKKQLLPVMVWIYGGAYTSGSSKVEKFGPDYFLEENVIIVTFNYRLGIFGFLSTEDYAATGNWGLKDQILALKWVQENIEKFGGDPNSVTIFGQSAGSASVSYLIQTPAARGLFHKAIMQSGTNLNQWAHARQPRKTAFAVAKLLDISTSDNRELVEQLRKVDYKSLHILSLSTDLTKTILHNPLYGLTFAPTIEVNHPGAVLTNMSHATLKNGDINRIPVIVGFNSEEAMYGLELLEYVRPLVLSFDLFPTRLVPGSLNIERRLSKILVSQLIRKEYFGWTPITLTEQRLIKFISDDQFNRPIYEYVRQSSKYAPTYFYIFSYEGPLGIDGKRRENPGVSHTEDNNYLWNKETNINNAPEEDILTRRRLLRLWTNFAKNGNPTPISDNLLQNVTWPPANIKSMVYLNIGTKLELNTRADQYSINFWDNIFSRYGNPPYNTY